MAFLPFLKEVTQEFLYNIVYNDRKVSNNNAGIEFRELSEIFQRKFGNRPMDYFGIYSKDGWVMFLKSCPGLQFYKRMVTISEETSKSVAYKKFNETKIHLKDKSTVAQYREVLICKACKLISEQTDADNTDVALDMHGNTALHLIAALPCIDHEPTLVKHLLDAGFDPLKRNSNGQTILHIIAGRMQAKVCEDENSKPVDIDCGSFGSSKFDPTTWPANDRIVLLQYLSDQQLTVLANACNKNGNTVLHEWVISLSTVNPGCLQLNFDEAEKSIGLKLLSFGADLRIQNDCGKTPLHFAYNSVVFQFLLEHIDAKKSAVCCRVRNERDETPLLHLVKFITRLASHSDDEKNMKALLLLGQLIEVVKNNDDVCRTVWMPDEDGNSAVDIILTAVKNTSRRVSPPASWTGILSNFLRSSPQNKDTTLSAFQKSSIELIERSLPVANTYEKNLLSILLNELDLVNIADAELRQRIKLLLKNSTTVNEIDSKVMFLRDKAKRAGSKEVQTLATGPKIDNRKRKILNCPKKHLKCAEMLSENDAKVTVLEDKYRYSNEDPIGSGAFSSIFVVVKDEVEDPKSGTMMCSAYALKRIEKAKRNPIELKREIKTLISISGKNENIIKYNNQFEDDNFQYLCLDLMDGDLNEFVTNDEVRKDLKDPSIRVKVTKQIIDGVAYLHQQNFVHRDLKPENILYTKHPELNMKIADFGLTKNMSTLSTMTWTVGSVAMAPGTRCWMAPELISSRSKEHSLKSDIFSLGLVLHYLITLGKHPFTTENEELPAHVIEKRIVDSQIQFDHVHHPEAKNFLQQLLNKNPSKRRPAQVLHQHPFLWNDGKKIGFLKAVGDRPEAKYPNSPLEQGLQQTKTGRGIESSPWDRHMSGLVAEMTAAKKYRTDKLIDLLRFIRNAYAHKQEKSLEFQDKLDENIFLEKFPFLVLDVFGVAQKLRFFQDEKCRHIQEVVAA